MNPTTLTDDELREAYVSECAMSMRMAADKLDNSAIEARIDLIADEMMARGIL